jgi:hypothetical protein
MAKEKMKLPFYGSFAWVCGFIGKLYEAVTMLSEGKEEVNGAVDFNIPASGWKTESGEDATEDYPNYIDVTVSGLLSSDIVAVTVKPGSTGVARAADFAATESYDGFFRLRCKTVPAGAIQAEYHITNTEYYAEEE